MTTLPLFPLHAVLFPEGLLRLRIFETRYVDMVRRCLREDRGFGVVLILQGREVGGTVRTAQVGTLARIIDFEKLADGLLGIAARGEQRFRIVSARQQEDGLNVAEVEFLPNEAPLAVPREYAFLADVLRRVLAQLDEQHRSVPQRFDDAVWLGARLTEILPLPLRDRQRCLEMQDPLERLAVLRDALRRAEPRGS